MFEVLYRVFPSAPVFVGLETGVSYYGLSSLGPSASLTSFPILSVFSLRLEQLFPQLALYVGLGIGASIDRLAGGNFAKTDHHFEFIVKPGAEFHGFFLEPRVGVLDNLMLFAVALGYRMRF